MSKTGFGISRGQSSPAPRRRGAIILLILTLLTGGALAQDFDGAFTAMGNAGPVKLTIVRSGLDLSGTIEGNGSIFSLAGEVLAEDHTVAYGTVEAPGGMLIFEAYLVESVLELYLFTPLADGGVDMDNVTVLEFAPASAGTLAPGSDATGEGGNPLTDLTASANPLAGAADPGRFAGIYFDGAVTLELQAAGAGYGGTLTFQGSTFPVEAQVAGDGLQGTFTTGADAFPFTFLPEEEGFILESDGASYDLAPIKNPLSSRGSTASSAEPQDVAATPQPAGASQVLATGQYGQFTHDAALAYIDALKFSLQQVGQAHILADTSDQQIIDALAANYPSLDPETQAVMADARQIWTETQAGWSVSSAAEKQEFVLAVLTIAYGEQSARTALGVGGNGGGNGGGSFGGGDYVGMPSPDPQIQEDTMNAQSCWAAAGCDSYDPVGNDFNFDNYDGY
ncbi:MAG: hypothetical protein WD273_06455 [Trueperaceae bacterium]